MQKCGKQVEEACRKMQTPSGKMVKNDADFPLASGCPRNREKKPENKSDCDQASRSWRPPGTPRPQGALLPGRRRGGTAPCSLYRCAPSQVSPPINAQSPPQPMRTFSTLRMPCPVKRGARGGGPPRQPAQAGNRGGPCAIARRHGQLSTAASSGVDGAGEAKPRPQTRERETHSDTSEEREGVTQRRSLIIIILFIVSVEF